ncbi:MAG: phosphoribosylformylglycinamidine synthase subunit PurQ, partial [Chloroflexi bacterium]|nr:phosphoribosylformylglycinamidine synthase subunit PurQ [Chloroflexota bacterium]
MRFAILVFPGTWSDHDCQYVLRDVLGQDAELVWHREADLSSYDCLVLPGGFSYGDYLRCGAMAAHSPAMTEVVRRAKAGVPVLGICNGFQMLTETGLLPGALLRNAGLKFVCRDVHIRVETSQSLFTGRYQTGQRLRVPIAHHDGNYVAGADELERLAARGQIAFRYCEPDGAVTEAANPNGAARNVAGVFNETKTVLGLMPHP